MKKLKLILLISIITMGISSSSLQAQKRGKKSADAKTELQEKRASLLMIRAEERTHGKYGITIDAGFNKEGEKNNVYRNKKEKELLENTINSASIVTVLELLNRAGYTIDQAYAVQNGDIIVHYYILKLQDRDINNTIFPKKKARNNQNRAQMSPDEIEKRKKMREKK